MADGALGGASFTVRADPAQFQKGMKSVKEEAVRTSQLVGAAIQTIDDKTFLGLAGVGRTVERTTKSFEKLGNTVGGGKGGRIGLGILALGQAVDDAQYGFRSIVNNIPQMVYMFGGSAGLAGGVGIAAVAINLLITRWDSLVDAMQSRWLNVAATDLEKLRIATEKAGEAFDALMKTPSELGARELSKFKEAVTNIQKGGGQGLFTGLAQAVPLEPGMRAEETPDEQKKRRITEGAIRRLEDPKHNPMLGEPDVKDLKKQIKEMDDHLNQRNGEIAKVLIGKSLQAGEEGDEARARVRALVNKYSKSFSPEFRESLNRNHPEAIQAEIDAENAKKARERARGVAGQMLGSRIGTQLMTGAGDQGGPITPDALAKMIQGPFGRRLAKRGLADAGGQMADAGLTAEQAKGVMAAMDIKKMYELSKARSKELGIPLGGMGQVDPRVLDEVYKKQFAEALKANKGKPGGIEAAVGKALKGAGVVGQDPKEVLGEMKAQLADRKRELMLGGMNAKQAESQILKEQQQKLFPNANMAGQSVGILQFHRMIQAGALNGAQDIAKRSLEELVEIRKALAARRQAPAGATGPMIGVAAGPN